MQKLWLEIENGKFCPSCGCELLDEEVIEKSSVKDLDNSVIDTEIKKDFNNQEDDLEVNNESFNQEESKSCPSCEYVSSLLVVQ